MSFKYDDTQHGLTTHEHTQAVDSGGACSLHSLVSACMEHVAYTH